MSRPNISKQRCIEVLKDYNGKEVKFTTLIDLVPFSQLTIRTSLASLVKDGIVEVNKESRPYTYKVV